MQSNEIQAYLGDTAGMVPDHLSKASIPLSESCEFFGFPVHIKVMFTRYYSLLKVL